MKNKLNIFILLFATILMVSCSEDETFTGPYQLVVSGPHGAVPQEQAEYTIGDVANPDSYAWTVEGPASIVGAASGNTVTVAFQEVGEVTVKVSNGPESGIVVVGVDEVPPTVASKFGTDNHGALRNGDQDTVFFSFASPIESIGSFEVNTDSSGFTAKALAFESGTLGPLQLVDGKYFAIYTAGDGNGTPEALFQDVKTTAAFGGVNIDSVYAKLYRVDNIAPIADLSYSHTRVNDSTVVTVTATFTEAVAFDFTQATIDSALYVSFSGGGVAAESDTLQPTGNPLVYTYEYTVNGKGTGDITVTLENIVDLAGNAIATTNNTNVLTVDNESPAILTRDAAYNSGYATVSMSANEGKGLYVILESGAAAPESYEDFTGGVYSGSFDFSGATDFQSKSFFLAPGTYDAYFIVGDDLGNYSAIAAPVTFTVTE